MPGPVTAPPAWTGASLSREFGISRRTLRHYVEQGLLAPADFRGGATTYDREHWIRLHAIRVLRGRNMGVSQIRRTLANRTLDDLERAYAPAAVAALDSPGPTAPSGPDVAAEEGPLPGAAWCRIPLVPGLELHVRADTTALVRRLAGEIHRRYAAVGDGG